MVYQAGTEEQVFTRMHALVREHNARQAYLRDTVRQGSLLTLKTLVQQAIKVLRKARHLDHMADSDEIPGVYTNRNEVAVLTQCGSRTVYDHLNKLEAAGLVYKQFRGRYHDFIVWISPWILVGDSFPRPKPTDLSIEQNPGFQPQLRPTLPPSSTLESSPNCTKSGVNSVEKLSDVVGKLIPPPNSPGGLHIRNFTLERAVDPRLPQPEKTLETGRGGARLTSPQPAVPIPGKGGDGPKMAPGDGKVLELRIPKPAVSHSQATVPDTHRTPRDFATKKLQKELVTGFWAIARQKFWPNDIFSEQHTRSVLNLIWNDVFGFNNGQRFNTDDESYTAYHRRVEQLRKAERWMLKKEWTSVMPPLAYFSREHYAQQKCDQQKGNFHHTEAWLLADEKAARRLDAMRLLERAIKSVVSGKPPRHFPEKDPSKLSLYGYWLNQVRKTGDAELIDAYNAGVAMAKNPVDFTPTQA